MRRHAKAVVVIFASLLSALAVSAGPAVARAADGDDRRPVRGLLHVRPRLRHGQPERGPEAIYLYAEYLKAGDSFWTSSYFGSISGAEAEGTGPISVETDLTDLEAGVEYEVRLNAYSEGENLSPGPNPNFTTTAVTSPDVALDPVGAVTGTTAQFSGTIDPEAPEAAPTSPAVEAGFKVEWRFECTPECPGLSGTVAADNSPHAVTATATGLVPNADYEVRLVADNAGPAVTTSPQSFTTAKVAPVATTLYAGAVSGSGATLRGAVSPRNSAVTYQFEWGLDGSYGNLAPAAATPLGAQDNSDHPVSAAIAGLAPGTTYHYRLVATNTETSAVGTGADQAFTTPSSEVPASCPNEVFRIGFAAALPECRAYEQVSPVDKDGLEMLVESGGVRENFLVGPGGESAQYLGLGAFADSATSLQFTHYLATRSGSEWVNHGTDIPQSAYPDAQGLALMGTSRDLSHSVSLSHAALTPDAVPKQFNIYLCDNRTGALELIFTLPTRPYMLDFTVDENIGGTPDYSHVLFRAGRRPRLPDAIRQREDEALRVQRQPVAPGQLWPGRQTQPRLGPPGDRARQLDLGRRLPNLLLAGDRAVQHRSVRLLNAARAKPRRFPSLSARATSARSAGPDPARESRRVGSLPHLLAAADRRIRRS